LSACAACIHWRRDIDDEEEAASMLARQEVDTLTAEVAQLRVELAESRAATSLANLRAELAQAHRDLEHLARVHLTTIAFYATEEHYPELIPQDRGARARVLLGVLLAEQVIVPDVAHKRPARRRS
jgi:hypothetical protein